MKRTASSPARPFAKILRALTGRYRATMLEGWAAESVDPFRHLIGTILSARCRDEVTDVVSRHLFEAYPTAAKLAVAPRAEIERRIRSIGFYRVKARYIIETSRMLMEEYGGSVPATLEELTRFPGVGRKVANCVLVYAFGKPAIAVDTHVHRVSNRLGWVKTRTPDQTERALEEILPRRHWLALNELLVAHGKATCRPVRALCSQCGVSRWCARVGVPDGPFRPSREVAAVPPSRVRVSNASRSRRTLECPSNE
ncbi:MAG TPA: endonuclease III [Planctomycetota bacterium]|nr:endonuclease III [Planctomycetota bacterium]